MKQNTTVVEIKLKTKCKCKCKCKCKWHRTHSTNTSSSLLSYSSIQQQPPHNLLTYSTKFSPFVFIKWEM